MNPVQCDPLEGPAPLGRDVRPKPSGGDRLSHRTEAHAGLIRAALAELPDITLPELKSRLAGQGASTSVASLWRYFRPHRSPLQTGRAITFPRMSRSI